MAAPGVDPTIAIAAVAGTVLMTAIAWYHARDSYIYKRQVRDFDAALREHECMIQDLIAVQQGQPLTEEQRERTRWRDQRPLDDKERKRVTKAQKRIERALDE